MTFAEHKQVHQAQCGIWEIPQTAEIEYLLANGVNDPTVATYLSAITPLYSAASRILSQLAGLLLLAMTSQSSGLPLDHVILSSAREQLQEASDRLRGLAPLSSALRHRSIMTDAMEGLAAALGMIDLTRASLDPHRRQQDVTIILRQLHVVQRLLIVAALPTVNIAPVDLSMACCTCVSGKSTNAAIKVEPLNGRQ